MNFWGYLWSLIVVGALVFVVCEIATRIFNLGRKTANTFPLAIRLSAKTVFAVHRWRDPSNS
jgi:hypothetical protein